MRRDGRTNFEYQTNMLKYWIISNKSKLSILFANAEDEKRRSIDGPTSHLNPNGLHSVSSHTRRDSQNYFTTK